MLPREHGAYGQLLFPLITALAIGRPAPAAAVLAGAIVCAFLAHEPLLVLLGQRGARAAREQRMQATQWFAGFATGAIVLGGAGIAVMDGRERSALVIPAVLVVVLVVIVGIGREHTAAGEVLSAIALSSFAFPVAVAAGAESTAALTCAAVFGAGFVAATLCVRAVIACTRRPPAIGARAGGAVTAIGVIVALVWLARFQVLTGIAPWAALPLCMGGVALVIAAPPARHLRRVGWTLVATSALSSVILMAGLR